MSRKKFYTIAINCSLAFFWALFLFQHILVFRDTGKPSALLFVIAESITILFFLTRKETETFSRKAEDWLFGAAGTFATTLFRANTSNDSLSGDIFLNIALIFIILSLFSLNRSFGIVPALREIKTTGLYRIVRHPIYASYFLTYASYLANNASLYNIVVCLLCVSFQLIRIDKEETLLRTNPEYLSYTEKVRFKLIPFIY